MAKLTLLTMVQKILSSMDSDDVNGVSGSEEALQICDVIEDTYFHILSQKDWPFLKQTCTLDSLSDTTRPTYLRVPDLISQITNLKYDKTKTGDANQSINTLRYLEPETFVDMTLTRNTGDVEIDSVLTLNNTPFYIYNDRPPIFWTSFDDEHVVMDAYDNTEENTLIGSKAFANCIKTPIFDKNTDTFVPDLPEELFPVLLSESKRAAHLYHKQSDSPVDAKRALQGISRARNHGWRTNDGRKKARYGRR